MEGPSSLLWVSPWRTPFMGGSPSPTFSRSAPTVTSCRTRGRRLRLQGLVVQRWRLLVGLVSTGSPGLGNNQHPSPGPRSKAPGKMWGFEGPYSLRAMALAQPLWEDAAFGWGLGMRALLAVCFVVALCGIAYAQGDTQGAGAMSCAKYADMFR